jgi:hypothetical protein
MIVLKTSAGGQVDVDVLLTEKQDTGLELVPIGDVYREAAMRRADQAKRSLVLPELRLFCALVVEKVIAATSPRSPQETRVAAAAWLFSEQTRELWSAFQYFGGALPPYHGCMAQVALAVKEGRAMNVDIMPRPHFGRQSWEPVCSWGGDA